MNDVETIKLIWICFIIVAVIVLVIFLVVDAMGCIRGIIERCSLENQVDKINKKRNNKIIKEISGDVKRQAKLGLNYAEVCKDDLNNYVINYFESRGFNVVPDECEDCHLYYIKW